jgi:hypothetical protein
MTRTRPLLAAAAYAVLLSFSFFGTPWNVAHAQSDVTVASNPNVDRLAADVAASLARHCPLSEPGDQFAFEQCRKRVIVEPQIRQRLPAYLLWGRQRDPNARLKDTRLTQFAPDVWTAMYLPLFMFNGKYTVEYVEHEKLFRVRLEAAFRNRLAPGQFPYPFWHNAEKWNTYENAKTVLLWVDPQRLTIKAVQFTRMGEQLALRTPEHVAHQFDGRWMWTDADGRTQPQVTLFDGLFSDENPHKPQLESAYREFALHMREGQCQSCHSPDDPDGMKKLVLLQTPAHAAGEIKRVLRAVRENRMPLDEFGIEEALDEQTKAALLKSGAVFDSMVDAAKAWEKTKRTNAVGLN